MMAFPDDRPDTYNAAKYYDEANEAWVDQLDLEDVGGAIAKEFLIAVGGDGSVYFGEL